VGFRSCLIYTPPRWTKTELTEKADGTCVVRRKGLVCESALATTMSPEEAARHPLAFNAGLL